MISILIKILAIHMFWRSHWFPLLTLFSCATLIVNLSIGWSVRRVGWSVGHDFIERWSYFRYCPCPTYASDAVVYTALFYLSSRYISHCRSFGTISHHNVIWLAPAQPHATDAALFTKGCVKVEVNSNGSLLNMKAASPTLPIRLEGKRARFL